MNHVHKVGYFFNAISHNTWVLSLYYLLLLSLLLLAVAAAVTGSGGVFFFSSLTQLLITPVVAGEKVEREGRCRSVSPERRIEELLGLVGWSRS